jgi:hypothetical protein
LGLGAGLDHETSSSHITFYQERIETESKLSGANAIANLEQSLAKKESERWEIF